MTTSTFVSRRNLVAAIAVILITAPGLAAQPASTQGPPNALQGFSQNRNQPVKIQSNSLEVRDKDKIATFFGDVHLIQGDTAMRCKTLVVFYEQNAPSGTAGMPVQPGQPGLGGAQQIRRVEAKGGVVVTQKDQTATGDSGIFDMKANKVRLEGNVVVSQGQSIIRGQRLVVDMTTGVSTVECTKMPCRVDALIVPGSIKDGATAPATGKDAPKTAIPGPLKLN